MTRMRAPLWVLIGLVGCNLDESPETSFDGVEIGIDPCLNTPYLCENSPGYLHGGMHELSLLGTPNAQGYRVELDDQRRPLVHWDGAVYRLDVVEGEIQGRAADGTTAFKAEEAVGAVIRIVKDSGVRVFDIGVDRYRASTYKIPLDDPIPDPVHFYVLTWNHIDNVPKDKACNPYQWPAGTNNSHLEGMEDGEVLLFAGDRFFPATFTLAHNPANTTGWITFGCAGQALAKLDLSANTRHRQGTDDWAGRQATLKLYVGNYCGDSKAWTVPGTPLVWRGPTTEYGGSTIDLEARWNASGASCLARPRLVVHPDPAFPGVTADQIRNSCTHALPVCTNTNLQILNGQPRISANH
jgi:hypothetical protein